MHHRTFASRFLLAAAVSSLAVVAASCGDDSATSSSGTTSGAGGGGGAGGSSTSGAACDLVGKKFEVGDLAGHADPFGAKDAGQARAGRIDDVSDVAQPAHGRQPIQNGDVVLVNDKIAVWIEAAGLSDGYSRYGGEVIAVDKVGDDGRPMGLSKFLETVMGVSLYVPETSSVSVLNDGSDGSAAIVRVTGPLRGLAFLEETFGGIFPDEYKGLEIAQDFVLEPGAEAVLVRFTVMNSLPYDLDTGVDQPNNDFLGFFQYSQNQMATPEAGFGTPEEGDTQFFAFDSAGYGFAYISADDQPLAFSGINESGFQLGFGPGYKLPACTETSVDHVRLVGGGPDYDGLRAAIRRVRGDDAWREITGVVEDDEGEPIARAWVHVLGSDGAYLSRTQSNADGEYTVHAPDDDVTLVAQLRGYPNAEAEVSATDDEATLSLGPTGIIHVVATQEGEGRRIPVRVQVIPTEAPPPTPEAFGVLDEVNGRLWQEFAVTGEATLHVPVGEHRVVVTRGYEWELSDTTIDVAAGETVEVEAALAHSVDTVGVMCADYHIHSFLSNDSSDPIDHKVKSAIADGLDIPVSSEHEWTIDFQPVIEDLGLEEWAFGVPSEELTTFKWGHFGVVPVQKQPNAYNNGALDWVGKEPPEVFQLVHEMPAAPILIVNHPNGSTGFSAYFTAADLDQETGTSDDPLWDPNFDAVEVFNSSDFESNRAESVKSWFALLNRAARGEGKKVWAVGSSDSHHVRTSPVGYARTCLRLGTDDPQDISQEDVRDATGAGLSIISGGLFMTIEGPGGAQPGDSVPVTDEATFTVTVEAPGWLEADSIEVIVNGETITVEDLEPIGEGPSNRYENEITVPLDGPSWVVFHAKGEQDLAPLHPGNRAFAASNPIWFE